MKKIVLGADDGPSSFNCHWLDFKPRFILLAHSKDKSRFSFHMALCLSVYSLVLDIWIQKERFHPLSILGRIIILAGVYLMNGQAVRHAFLKRQKSFAS
jgi:hypothetical protein